ncbi:unnamed protein product [Arabidopsis thaliana]|uniref:Uncharacterized protein n=1 Tax=Arabidopsis thaliana TaxID=3702 RepID=A0A5S9XQ80_ARATH|nr:unnamed protein product [Arabidopsis thaliana]
MGDISNGYKTGQALSPVEIMREVALVNDLAQVMMDLSALVIDQGKLGLRATLFRFLHPPPRVPTPPLNPQELAAVTPYFPTSRPSAFQAFTVPTTQAGVRRHQVFPDSNISQASGAAITSGVRQVFEVGKSSRGAQDGESHNNMHLGESCKRKNLIILQRDKESRQHKQQETEQRMGGILKPPKKR